MDLVIAPMTFAPAPEVLPFTKSTIPSHPVARVSQTASWRDFARVRASVQSRWASMVFVLRSTMPLTVRHLNISLNATYSAIERISLVSLGRKKPLSFREIRTRLFPVAKIGQVISFLKQCLGIRRVETELSGLRRLEPGPKEDHECKGADQDRDASGHPQPPGKTRHHSDVTLQ